MILEQGEQEQLVATVLPADADDRSVRFTSNNEEIATINNEGVVTGVSDGETTITATTTNDLTAICSVEVIALDD